MAQVRDFSQGLRPIQVDDDTDSTVSTMGRAALQVRVQAGGRPVDLITCHLKSTSNTSTSPTEPAVDGVRGYGGSATSSRTDASGFALRPVLD